MTITERAIRYAQDMIFHHKERIRIWQERIEKYNNREFKRKERKKQQRLEQVQVEYVKDIVKTETVSEESWRSVKPYKLTTIFGCYKLSGPGLKPRFIRVLKRCVHSWVNGPAEAYNTYLVDDSELEKELKKNAKNYNNFDGQWGTKDIE